MSDGEGTTDVARPAAPQRVRVPWQASASAALLGIGTGQTAVTALFLGASVFVDHTDDGTSAEQQLLFFVLTAAGATLLGWLALGVHRGRRVQSVVVVALGAAVLLASIGALTVWHSTDLREALFTVAGPVTVAALVASGPHRRYVAARLAARRTIPQTAAPSG